MNFEEMGGWIVAMSGDCDCAKVTTAGAIDATVGATESTNAAGEIGLWGADEGIGEQMRALSRA